MEDKAGKERIRSACIQCQKRKKRCDGGKPSCANCSKGNAPCKYTERRSRGPGKKNNRVEHLETRLKTLESALRLQERAPDPVSESQAAGSVQPVQLQGSEVNTTSDSDLPLYSHPEPVEPSRTNMIGRSGDSKIVPGFETHTNENPPPTIFEAQQPLNPAQIISKYSEFTNGIKSTYQWIRAQENRGISQGRVFARLPTYEQVRSLVEPIVEPLQQHGVAITTESWVKLLDEQYSGDPDSYADDPARWAIVNSFFATAMLNRSTTDFLVEVVPTAWSYFKNAFSMFPELITHGRGVSACEALAAMVMFSQCTADAQLTTQITAALTCLVKTLGMHRKRHYDSLGSAAFQRHQRISMVAYILEVDAMEKYDISPSLENEELGTPFVRDASTTERTSPQTLSSFDLLRWRFELAIIQRRIYEQLRNVKDPGKDWHELSNTVESMDKQLQAWRSSLPESTCSIDDHIDELDFASSIAVLLCSFYNTMSKLHMAVVHAKAARHTLHDGNMTSKESSLDSEMKSSWNKSVASAREIIVLMGKLASQPFFRLCGSLCYPLSAVLNLLLAILQSPATPAAQDNVGRIGHFVDFLGKLAGDGCDVQRLWNLCTKLHDVASCAISTSQAEENSQSQEVELGRSSMLSQLEAIRAKLARAQDWLQIAEGLFSNLPLLRVEAEEMLSGISGLGTPQGIYGLCVPDLLKSQNFHTFILG